MKLYTYAQHTARAGQVCCRDEEWCVGSADVWLFGEGTREELIAEARNALLEPGYTPLAKREADHVLDYFGEKG